MGAFDDLIPVQEAPRGAFDDLIPERTELGPAWPAQEGEEAPQTVPEEVSRFFRPPAPSNKLQIAPLADVNAPMPEPKSFMQEVSEPLVSYQLEHPANEGVLEAVGREAANLALGVAEFPTSELGVAAGVAGSLAPTATAGAFTLQMMKDLGNQVLSTYQNWGSMTPAQKAIALTDIAGTGVLGALMGRATAKGLRRIAKTEPTIAAAEPILPQAAQAAKETKGAEEYASEVSKAAEVYGDLQPPTGEGEGQVPTEGRGRGVQPQAGGGLPIAEAQAPHPEPEPRGLLLDATKAKLKQIGWNDADIADLEAGNLSVPDIVARKLRPFDIEYGGGPEHAKALEEARFQGVADAERILAEKAPLTELTPAERLAEQRALDEALGQETTEINKPIPNESIKQGDTIQWNPKPERAKRFGEIPVSGIVQDVIRNQEGEIGFNIFAPTQGDPTRVVRVWSSRGDVVSRELARVVAPSAGRIESTSTPISAGRTPQRPKTVIEIADEIAARGVDPQASYGQFVKARDLKPEISAKEWLPIYRKSLELAKLNKEIAITKKPAPQAGATPTALPPAEPSIPTPELPAPPGAKPLAQVPISEATTALEKAQAKAIAKEEARQVPEAEPGRVLLKGGAKTGSISFESLDEPSGEWQARDHLYVISKSTIPGDKPWRMTVFTGPPDSPTAIGHIQIDSPDVLPIRDLRDLSEQMGRYNRKFAISNFQISGESYFFKPTPQPKVVQPGPSATEPSVPTPGLPATPGAKPPSQVPISEATTTSQITQEPFLGKTKAEWTPEYYKSLSPENRRAARAQLISALKSEGGKTKVTQESKPPAVLKGIHELLDLREKKKAAPLKFTVSEDKTSVTFTDNKTGNTIVARIERVPGEKGEGAFIPLLDITTPTRVGGSSNPGNFTQSFEQAQAQLKQMLESKGFSGLQASKITEPTLAYGGSWKEGVLEKQKGYDPEVAAEHERFVGKIEETIEQVKEQFSKQRQPEPFGSGPPEAGQWLSEQDIAKIPKLVRDYGDFWVVLKWAASERDMMKASYLAKHYDKIVKGKEAANKYEYLREVFVRTDPFKDITPPSPPMPPGPGAKTVGEPPYAAAQQLTDQLRATQPAGAKDAYTVRQKIADAWAEGKSLFERAVGRSRVTAETLKDTVRGARSITDLDRRVGELDWLLQKSAGQSRNMSKAIMAQQKSKTTREAVALWIDAGRNEQLLRDTLAQLPANTKPSIRRALEVASNLPPEAKQFAQQIEQFYGIRLQDARQAEIFEKSLDDYFTHIWKREGNMPDKLRVAYSTGRVSDYFQFARQRKLPMFLDGILQGKVPELDPAKVVPYYNYALDRSIASRQFVKELSDIDAPDGRPAVLPMGTARKLEPNEQGAEGAMFINPKGKSELGKDYHVIDHPAMRKWKWLGSDEQGNPVMYRSDLAANPLVHERLARMLDQRLATPSKVGKALLRASTEVKGFKLGLLSAFHQVHVGSHALFHWTNPFKTAEIDWESPATRYAVEKGHLKLAGDASQIAQFSEGLLSPGLVHKIPILGPLSKAYSEWLFTDYIPRLKLKTFENAYTRNLELRDKLPWSGLKGLTNEQVAARVGDSVNNAYGELNHWFLGKYGRSPQFQRILRGIFLAPDFGEARLRFVAKALTKAGLEERIALATMFLTLYVGARVANWLSHGDPEVDLKNAFRVKAKIPGKDRMEWISMRSVVGDLAHALTGFGQFMYVRLNPLYSRTITDVLFQRDVYGRKLSLGDIALKRPAQQLVPINFTGLTRDDQQLWESAVTSMGLQVQHDVPALDIGKLKRKWLLSNPDPKLRAMGERNEAELFPPSDYSPLRRALLNSDMEEAGKAYDALKTDKGKKLADIREALRPITGGREVNGVYHEAKIKPIGGQIGVDAEAKFKASLTPAERRLYQQAIDERKMIWAKFLKLMETR